MARIFFFCFFFSSITLMSAQSSYLEDFSKKWDNAAAYTLEIAEMMPEEDYEYRPTDDQMSFREQLLHMVGNMSWLSHSYLNAPAFTHDLRKASYTKEEVLNILREGFEGAGQAVGKLSTDNLNEEVDFFAGPMNKRQILTLMNDHLTHHRGQLIVYLRLRGLQPPRYRGW